MRSERRDRVEEEVTQTLSGALAARIRSGSGENPYKCYLCKKCSTGCPVAHFADVHPAQVMRAVQLGDEAMSVDSRFIWLCTGCETCTTRCPQGIDVYFDNVGGEITDAAVRHINVAARLVISGQISQYNLEKPEMGPRWLWALIVKQARAEGFLVFQFRDRFEGALRRMAQWVKEGKLKYRENIVEGIENAPRAFIGMLKGENIGKQLVKIAEL